MTDEDKKLILEFCGFKLIIDEHNVFYWQFPDGFTLDWLEPPPKLDLNFYFKYAYPQIPKFQRYTFLSLWIIEVVNGIDPAEAFGQALLKLIKEKR